RDQARQYDEVDNRAPDLFARDRDAEPQRHRRGRAGHRRLPLHQDMRVALPLLLALAAPAGAETIYISDEAGTAVHVVDGATLRETGRIEVGKRPRGIGLSPDGKILYVAVSDDNRIVAVDRATGTVRIALDNVPDPETVALSPDGARMYIANEDDSH